MAWNRENAKAQGRGLNKESRQGDFKARKQSGSGTVRDIETVHSGDDASVVQTGYEGTEGVRFKLQPPIISHDRLDGMGVNVKETLD